MSKENNPNATFNLPRDLIEGALREHVTSALGRAFDDNGSRIVTSIIDKVVNVEVDRNGKPAKYRSEVVGNWIDIIVKNIVQDEVKQIITEEVGKLKPLIREMLLKELHKKNSPLIKKLVQAMTDGMVEASTRKWGIVVDIKPPSH